MILCSALILLFLFGAGIAAGFLLAGHTPGQGEMRQDREPVKKETSRRLAPKAPAANIAERSGSSTAAAGGITSSATGAQQRLSIEAGSFPDESQASHLAALLQRDGYHPVLTGPDSAGSETSYYVRLGPYQSWEQASRIASELDRSYALHTVVKPLSAVILHS